MEFLGMADAMYRSQRLLELTSPSTDCRYTSNTQRHLRVLLFLNPRIEQIRNEHQGNNIKSWTEWLETMRREAAVSDSFTGDFEYLRKRFDRFDDLVNRVTLLNKITLDPEAKNKWSNRLLFPIGPSALYEVSNEDFSSHYNVFTRTGEIAYLMLSRASAPLRADVAKNLTKLFQTNTARNRLVLSLCPDGSLAQGEEKGGSYLPYKRHPAFDRLAEDINNLLKLNLPNQDVLEHLRYILGLNLYVYAVETANHWLGKPQIPPLPCEIPGPKMNVVRKASGALKEENETHGLEAVHKYMEAMLKTKLQELNEEGAQEELKAESLADYISEIFSVDKQDIASPTIVDVLEKTRNIAKDTYLDTLDGIQALGAGAGLIDKRGTNRMRYAPTDKLLRALVLATVKHPVEEDDLLALWWERYGIVIGPDQLSSLPEVFNDASDFEKNKRRFSNRLAGLGLSNRMSDSCTYVRNPYLKE